MWETLEQFYAEMGKQNRKAKLLTVYHDPEKEKDLVESRGGVVVVEKPGKIPRVDGELAMKRAFVDCRLKEHITSKPDVRFENIDDDTEVILANDVMWKVAPY